jgi:hypothetical protein
MQDNQLGVGRTGDEIERHAIALAVAVGPRGTDFEPGAFLAVFLLDDRVNAMRRAVAVGFSRHSVALSALELAPMAASMPVHRAKRLSGAVTTWPPGHPKGRGAAQAAGAEANGFDQHRALRQKTCISRGRLAGLPATKGRWR